MTENKFVQILVAEDNDVSRDMIISILRTKGYGVHGAVDGESAIKVIEDKAIDLALVDVNMSPKGGFDFAKYVLSKGQKIPIIFVTGSDSADLLMKASSLGVTQVIQKPVQPDRILRSVDRVLKQKGINPMPMGIENKTTKLSPEQLMHKAIELAAKNARIGAGGAFAAILATQDGQIISEGTNKKTSRVDPIAHAEVMAIRTAAEAQGRSDLFDCVLYCTSEPTAIGAALIESVGIKKVYYALTHAEVGIDPSKRSSPEYHKLLDTDARQMYIDSKKRN